MNVAMEQGDETMIYLSDTYENMADKIKKSGKRIIVYGAGMIGHVLVPYLIEKFSLQDNLLFFIDGDKNKQGNYIEIGEKSYLVKSPDELTKLSLDTVLLITNSNYAQIIRMLDGIENLNNVEAYIIPILQVLETHKKGGFYAVRKSETPMIPKKIHYCWFSKKTMPDFILKCIDSWYKFCPDFEIIRWDEDNYDVNKVLYMKQAYAAKKYGFVPDIARLDLLYNYGGIYLDTDIELIKPLDDLLYQPAFAGVEKWGSINLGGCSGAVPYHPVIKKMLDYRIHEKFIMEDGSFNQTTCGYYETKPLIELGMKPDNTIQNIAGMTIYSSDFFHPYDYMSGETCITDNTYSIHHFNGGWLDEKSMIERKRTVEQYKNMLVRMNVTDD